MSATITKEQIPAKHVKGLLHRPVRPTCIAVLSVSRESFWFELSSGRLLEIPHDFVRNDSLLAVSTTVHVSLAGFFARQGQDVVRLQEAQSKITLMCKTCR